MILLVSLLLLLDLYGLFLEVYSLQIQSRLIKSFLAFILSLVHLGKKHNFVLSFLDGSWTALSTTSLSISVLKCLNFVQFIRGCLVGHYSFYLELVMAWALFNPWRMFLALRFYIHTHLHWLSKLCGVNTRLDGWLISLLYLNWWQFLYVLRFSIINFSQG